MKYDIFFKNIIDSKFILFFNPLILRLISLFLPFSLVPGYFSLTFLKYGSDLKLRKEHNYKIEKNK